MAGKACNSPCEASCTAYAQFSSVADSIELRLEVMLQFQSVGKQGILLPCSVELIVGVCTAKH